MSPKHQLFFEGQRGTISVCAEKRHEPVKSVTISGYLPTSSVRSRQRHIEDSADVSTARLFDSSSPKWFGD